VQQPTAGGSIRDRHVDRRGHTVVCGFDGIAIRIVEELLALDEHVVVVVGDRGSQLAGRARELNLGMIVGDCCDPAILRRAGVESAEAIALVNDDDASNLHAALAAQELNAGVRFAIRMFDTHAGEQLEKLFASCRIISTSEVAAPAFAHAARFGNSGQRFVIKGKGLRFKRIEPGDEVVAHLAAEDDQGVLHLFSDRGRPHGLVGVAEQEDQVTSLVAYQAASALAAWKARAKAIGQLVDRRLLYVFAFLFAVAVVSTVVFGVAAKQSPLRALYFTVTTISTVGYGDITPTKYGTGVELYTMGLMIVSALTLVALYALFTDVVVGVRLARTLGTHPTPQRDHVVVCGLGSIGYRVVRELVGQGIPCVAIEENENSPFIDATRHLKVPVIVADATRHGALDHVHLTNAIALMAVTNHDMANLQISLAARAIAPRTRIVLRLFDPDFAQRVEGAFSFHVSRSVAGIAAPAFVDALMERRLLATVPVGSRLLAIRELRLGAHHAFAGRSVGEVSDTGLRVLAVGQRWGPSADHALHPGDDLIVISPRRAHHRPTAAPPRSEKSYR
jgi:Trk K+ transport system NAD-binding subunit